MIKTIVTSTCVCFLIAITPPLFAGLRDIEPRPQQMGYLAADPILIPGGFYLVMAPNPTADEARIRDLAVSSISARTYRTPSVITPNQANGRSSTIWLVTNERYPLIMSALDSTDIPGLGAFTHDEEYQIFVDESRIICAANDNLGMRWAVQSLMHLLSEAAGNVFVDHVYIRDWPDYNIRVATINNSCRSQAQVDYCNTIIGLSYLSRVNEIEWNNGDAGQSILGNPWTINQALILRQSIANLGFKLTMSCDRTAYKVTHPSWQEGVPQNGTPMRVTSTGFTIIPNGFGVGIDNPGFESWTGLRPNDWTVYDDPRWAYISRDTNVKHSGSSSVRWTSQGPNTPNSLELRQEQYFGAHRWIVMRFWYKTQNFTGQLRFNVYGPPPVATGCDFTGYIFSNSTQDWTMAEHRFSTYFIDSVLFMIGPDVARQGTIWVDDITLEAAEPQDVLHRNETTLTVFKRPTNEVMLEGYDYQVVETDATITINYFERPRLERILGGRLNVNDSVFVNWYCAIPYQSGRETPCWSLYDNIVDYQQRVRNLDSLLRPDAFKIHINEVSYANYDPLCLARSLSCGALVGSYCRQMYEAIQARRTGAKVRIYGDPIDIWVNGPRAMPISQTPWTVGALQELHPSMEIMAMKSYSTDLDSSFSYFQSYGFPSLVAVDGGNFPALLEAFVIAKRWPQTCRGTHFYDYDLQLYEQLGDFGNLSWNLGPYFVHSPISVDAPNPASLTITTQAWSDTFRSTTIPSLVNKRVRYRLLPSGNWTDATLMSIGTEMYSATVNSAGASGIEYYLSATDHRGQTRTSPADAPARTYLVLFPESPPVIVTPGYTEIHFSIAQVGGATLIEWPVTDGIKWYEVRYDVSGAGILSDMKIVSRQSVASPRYLLAPDRWPELNLDHMHVYAVSEDNKKTTVQD